MTFIEFGNKKNKYKTLYSVSFIVLIGMIVANIGIYNNLIATKHKVDDLKEAINTAQIKNVELEDQIFNTINTIQAETFLQERGYVSERSPSYTYESSILSHQDL